MRLQDAARFPIIGSMVLFSLFLAFKFLPKNLVNAVLAGAYRVGWSACLPTSASALPFHRAFFPSFHGAAYFVALGLVALTATAEPLLAPFFPPSLTRRSHSLRVPPIPLALPEGTEVTATRLELLVGAASGLFCAWYLGWRHWLANNVLGIAFSVQGIEHLSLGSVGVGVILLVGLFFYDIFWVFFTPVMVSVAKNFDAPIKLLFPRGSTDARGHAEFSMLGLGDIVIPGIFLAIVLRYDAAHWRKPRLFLSAMGGYVAGLAATIVVMNAFQHAQPALLYLVPAVLASTLGHAALVRRFGSLLSWHEQEHHEKKEAAGERKATSAGKPSSVSATSGGAAPETDSSAAESSPQETSEEEEEEDAAPRRRSARTRKDQ